MRAMTRINYIHKASPGDHFTPRAFDDMIGKEVPVRVGSTPLGPGRVVAVKVSADGGNAKVRLELPMDGEEIADQIRRNGSELAIDWPSGLGTTNGS